MDINDPLYQAIADAKPADIHRWGMWTHFRRLTLATERNLSEDEKTKIREVAENPPFSMEHVDFNTL